MSGRRWLVAFALLVACGGKLCAEPFLAELGDYQGEVQRDRARAVGSWGAAARGDKFAVGDGLRTGDAASAQLALVPDGLALIEANTVVRFLDRDPRGAGRRLALEEGVVRIESGKLDLDVHTPRGLARVSEGSTLRIVSAPRQLRFDVLVGRVAIDASGAQRELVAGEQFELPADGAAAAAAAVHSTAAPEPPAPARPAAAGEISLPGLEPMTLHTPSLPLVLRLPARPCADGRELTAEVDGRRIARDAGQATLVLRIESAGAHRVRLRCGQRVMQDTTLQVARDAATLESPRSAQEVEIDADGRRYTVRYQNVLPIVTLRWRDARPASSYALFLRRGKLERRFRTKRPERVLSSRELAEGNYDFWFTSDNGQRSASGALRIEFDNTARSLWLSEPPEHAVASGTGTVVSGGALLRSAVSANGVPLPLDAKGRFRAQVPLGAEKSVLVRAIHPSAGVHYYVRRLR